MRQIIGTFLIIIGVAYFAFRGFSYTSHERMMELGPIAASRTSHNELIPYSPLLGGALIGGGLILFLAGFSRREF